MIREATKSEITDWNKLITRNPAGGHVFQTTEWNSFKAISGWQPLYWVYQHTKADKPVYFTLLRKSLPAFGTTYVVAKGPELFKLGSLSHKDKATMAKFIGELKAMLVQHDPRALLLKLEPEILADELDMASLGMIKARADLYFKATILVDIDRNDDELLASFKQKTRYNIRLAERKGVVVEERPVDTAAVDQMYDMMSATQARASFYLRPKAIYADYWQRFANSGLGKLLVATHEGQDLAFVYLFLYGKRAYYKDGGSYRVKQNLMAPYLLQFRAMQWARDNGASVYDTIAVPPRDQLDNPNHHQAGLYRFKSGFNPEVIEFVGAWDLPLSNRYDLWRRAEAYYLAGYMKLNRGNIFW